MSTRTMSVSAAMLIALLALVIHGAQRRANAQTRPGFDLRRLTQLHDEKLSSTRAAQLYLSFLQEEISKPSAPSRGIGGGAITHSYILAQIVLAGRFAKADKDVLWKSAAAAPPGEYCDAVMLTLGLLGEQRARSFLIGYLGNPNNPAWLRERAARALADNPDPAAIPVLAAALGDPFWVRGGHSRQPLKDYPIRSEARLALRRLQGMGVRLPADVQRALDTVVVSEPLLPGTPPPSSGR